MDIPTFAPTLMQRGRLLATGHPVYAFAASVPVLSFYGGATVTRAHDANKRLFTVCCAKNLQINAFGLYSLQDGVAQQIAPLVSGRGSIWISLVDGTAEWVGWDGNAPPQGGPIPGFAPIKIGAGAAGYTAAPKGTVRVFMDVDGFDGKQTVNLAAYGIPPCQALNVRLALDADAGRVFRCGPPTDDPNLQTAAMLTVTALGPPRRAYESGVISTTPSRTLLVMTENGPIAAGFVDITGWWA